MGCSDSSKAKTKLSRSEVHTHICKSTVQCQFFNLFTNSLSHRIFVCRIPEKYY